MGPSQICGCPFREPRVFEIAHIYIFLYIYIYIRVRVRFIYVICINNAFLLVVVSMLYRQMSVQLICIPSKWLFFMGKMIINTAGGPLWYPILNDEAMWTTPIFSAQTLPETFSFKPVLVRCPGAWRTSNGEDQIRGLGCFVFFCRVVLEGIAGIPGLVNVIQKAMERSTMLLMGKSTNFLWPFSIANC